MLCRGSPPLEGEGLGVGFYIGWNISHGKVAFGEVKSEE